MKPCSCNQKASYQASNHATPLLVPCRNERTSTTSSHHTGSGRIELCLDGSVLGMSRRSAPNPPPAGSCKPGSRPALMFLDTMSTMVLGLLSQHRPARLPSPQLCHHACLAIFERRHRHTSQDTTYIHVHASVHLLWRAQSASTQYSVLSKLCHTSTVYIQVRSYNATFLLSAVRRR